MTITANVTYAKIQLSDEYNFAGSDSSNTVNIELDFKASFLDQVGATYTGSAGQVPSNIAVTYTNNFTGDTGTFMYSYRALI
jgi:hypothetical protein